MHISMYDAVRVEVRDGGGKLAEQTQSLKGGKFGFAELLPAGDVVGAFGAENQGVDFFENLNVRN